MNKQQAMAMLKFISELYSIISTPEPQPVPQNGKSEKVELKEIINAD